MATSAIDGLVSGLNTTQVVDQLMALERQPQNRLRTQKDDEQKRLDTYNTLNSKLRTLADAARALRFESGWTARKAVVSDENALVATAGPGSFAANLSLKVDHLAASHAVVSSSGVSSLSATVASGPLTVGSTVVSDIGDGSLSSVVSAINASGSGVVASAVQVSSSEYRLQLTARSSGDDGVFTASGFDPALGSMDVLTQGRDAQVSLGGTNPITITSPTNTFAGLADGLTVTVRKATTDVVTIDLRADADAATDRVQKMVDAYNDVLAHVSANSGYDPATKKAGLLLGEQAASQIIGQLRETLAAASSGSTNLFGIGLSTDRTGRITLDKSKFSAAYQADRSTVEALFKQDTAGFAVGIHDAVTKATTLGVGRLAGVIASKQERIRTLDASILAWDDRLERRQDQLRKQFNAMETTLGKLRNQSSWLAGQINQLG
jgi:flagellar hook-associated protein 2